MSFIYLFCKIFIPPQALTNIHIITTILPTMSLNSNNIIPNAQDMYKEVPNNNKNKSGGNPAKSFVAASCSTDTSRPVELSVMVLYVG